MPKFIVARDIPGAGRRTPEQRRPASQRSVEVRRELGPQIFPANRVSQGRAGLDPTAAEE